MQSVKFEGQSRFIEAFLNDADDGGWSFLAHSVLILLITFAHQLFMGYDNKHKLEINAKTPFLVGSWDRFLGTSWYMGWYILGTDYKRAANQAGILTSILKTFLGTGSC